MMDGGREDKLQIASDTQTHTNGWPAIVTLLIRALKSPGSLVPWSSIPWLLGWATLSVMGPVVVVKLAYRTLHLVLDRLFNNHRVLCGKVVLITGASSGLGEQLAHVFYRYGTRLILVSRNTERLHKLKDTLLATYKPPEVHIPMVVQMDLEDLNNIASVVEGLKGSPGHVDILINNAGVSFRGSVLDTDLSIHIKLMLVNYFGHVALTKALLPGMIKRGSGHIVNISSIQGRLAIPYRSCYTASKHALQAFSDCLRAEVANNNIKVTVVSPGYIATNLSVNAITETGAQHGEMDETTARGMEADKVAEKVLRAVLHGSEEVLLAPAVHRAAVLLRALLPSLIFRYMRRRADRQRQGTTHSKRQDDSDPKQD